MLLSSIVSAKKAKVEEKSPKKSEKSAEKKRSRKRKASESLGEKGDKKGKPKGQFSSVIHEFHETCHSVTFYFMKKLIF